MWSASTLLRTRFEQSGRVRSMLLLQHLFISNHVRRISKSVVATASSNQHLAHASTDKATIWTSNQVRQAFIDYFEKHEHCLVPAISVMPSRYQPQLFVGNCLSQFRPVFLANDEKSPCLKINSAKSQLHGLARVLSIQKCIRLTGMHNDLDKIGSSLHHHTFLEMLGNLSLNNAYYKFEACQMAWNLLLDVFKLDRNRLLITYFGGDAELRLDEDEETKQVWQQLGISDERIIRLGLNENFWRMDEDGPCGACTVIHYILSEKDASDFTLFSNENRISPTTQNQLQQLQLGMLSKSLDIWNLTFIEYNISKDGKIESLPSRHVGTKMGLERILSVLNNTTSNYDTDLFTRLLEIIQQEIASVGIRTYESSSNDELDIAYRIIVDHVRTIAVTIADGCIPSKLSTGLCLRTLIRRVDTILQKKFHQKSSMKLFQLLISEVVQSLSHAFPDLVSRQEVILKVIEFEISEFHAKKQQADKFIKDVQQMKKQKSSGFYAMRIHQKFGLDEEIMREIAEMNKFAIDWPEYHQILEEERKKELEILRKRTLKSKSAKSD